MGREQIGDCLLWFLQGEGEPPLQFRDCVFGGQQSPCAAGSDIDLPVMLPGLSFLLCKTGLFLAINEMVHGHPLHSAWHTVGAAVF